MKTLLSQIAFETARTINIYWEINYYFFNNYCKKLCQTTIPTFHFTVIKED